MIGCSSDGRCSAVVWTSGELDYQLKQKGNEKKGRSGYKINYDPWYPKYYPPQSPALRYTGMADF